MLRKLTLIMAAAALLMPMSAIAAQKTGGGHSAGHSSSGKIGRSPSATSFQGTRHDQRRAGTQNRTKYVGTQNHTKYIGTKNRTKHVTSKYGHRHYSHRRHFYHGVWWSYGVGSCWAYDPEYGEYYWVCGN